MGLNLGLEALGTVKADPEIISYEYLDAVFQYSQASDEVTVVCDKVDSMFVAIENLIAIRDVISEQGVTPALESLVGGNFEGGISAEAVEASVEGFFSKIGDMLVSAWTAILNFFRKLFGITDGLKKRLEEFEKLCNKDNATLKAHKKFKSIEAADIMKMQKFVKAIVDEKLTASDINAISDKPDFAEHECQSLDSVKSHINVMKALLKAVIDSKADVEKHGEKMIAAAQKLAKSGAKTITIKGPAKDKLDAKTTDEKGKDLKTTTTADEDPGSLSREAEEMKRRVADAKKLINGWVKPAIGVINGFIAANTVSTEKAKD